MLLYDHLEVDATASSEEIKKAYYKLSLQYHPDKNPDGVEKFRQIKDSYEILSNEHLRTIYDLGSLTSYLNMKDQLLGREPEEYIKYFSIFGDQVTSTYSKHELLQDLRERNFDKITAIVLKANREKDPVFTQYYMMIGISFGVAYVGIFFWNIIKSCFKYTFYGLLIYYVGYRRILI